VKRGKGLPGKKRCALKVKERGNRAPYLREELKNALRKKKRLNFTGPRDIKRTGKAPEKGKKKQRGGELQGSQKQKPCRLCLKGGLGWEMRKE